MHPLNGSYLKIKHAKSEIEQFRLAQKTFFENTHYYIVKAEFNPKTNKQIYRVKIDGPPPNEEWGILIGEIIHNLRCALDYLVQQLALLNTNRPDNNTEFPICLRRLKATKGKFVPYFIGERGSGKYLIRSLNQKHQRIIEQLQPYHRVNSPPFINKSKTKHGSRSNPLWWLREINNADKHRLIQIVGIKPGAGPVIAASGDISTSNIRFFSVVLKDGAKFCEAPQDVHIDSEILPIIAFSDGCIAVKNIGVIYVLDKIYNTVYEIVDKFKLEFEEFIS